MELFSTFVVRPEEETCFLPILPEDYEARKHNTFLIGAAAADGAACGVAWLAREGVRLRLLHLETAKAYQGRGVASQLLDDLYTVTCRMRVPLPITTSFSRTQEHEAFYRLLSGRREVVPSLETRIYRIMPVCRVLSQQFHRLSSGKIPAERFWEMAAEEREAFLRRLDADGRELLKEIPEEAYCRDLCFSCGKPPHSAIFLTRTGKKRIELSFLYVRKDPAAPQNLIRLIRSACAVLKRDYRAYELDIFTQDLRLQEMICKIFPSGIRYIDQIRADWVISKRTEGV